MYRFLHGFGAIGLLSAIRAHSKAFETMFMPSLHLTSKQVKSLFTTVYTSTIGSDRRKAEIQRRAWFDDFLDLIQSGRFYISIINIDIAKFIFK